MSNIQKSKNETPSSIFPIWVYLIRVIHQCNTQGRESEVIKSTKMFSRNLDCIWHVFLAKVSEQSSLKLSSNATLY